MKRSRIALVTTGAVLAATFACSCSNRLGPYRDLLVGTPADECAAPTAGEVQVTYLGVHGYLIRSADTTLMVDPYFSRLAMRDVLFNAPVAPSAAAIGYGLRRGQVPRRIDGYLVTHSHFDHLFDIPWIQKRFGGRIVTSPTGRHLSEAMDVSRRNILPSLPGVVHRIGGARIHVLAARHDTVLGRAPYPGRISQPLTGPPDRARDWRLGTPLAFLVEIEGRRIYLESGGVGDNLPRVSDVDLAILGVAVRDSQQRYPEAVRALSPRYVLPSHQDDFFRPVEEGFHFSSLANFPRIKASHEGMNLPGRLILMDYFHTWSVPAPGK